jgi:hypothetical protein
MEFTDIINKVENVEVDEVDEVDECEQEFIRFIPYEADVSDELEFSAYHYHHNREPFYVMFIKKGDNIYIEMINDGTHRNKYTNEIVMPFEEMVKNKSLKKYYDMAVMLVKDNNTKRVYYDTQGRETKSLIQTYDTDSEDEEGKDIPIRHWCINTDINWKGMRVSEGYYLNSYYNIDPFKFEYKANTEKEINGFMKSIDAFAEYHNVGLFMEREIIANYNAKCQPSNPE